MNKYVEILSDISEFRSGAANFDFNLSYTDLDFGILDENQIQVWQHDGTSWKDTTWYTPGTYGVSTDANEAFADINDFGAFQTIGFFRKLPTTAPTSFHRG